MSREWRNVPGFPRYAVSDDGLVKSLAREVVESGTGKRNWRKERQLKSRLVHGYPAVTLYNEVGDRKHPTVHRLVLLAFVGPCPEGMQACHNDGTRDNNHVSNLRWDTIHANAADKKRHGTMWQLFKTECPKGHPYTPENTRPRQNASGGVSRSCRTCERAYHRTYKRRRRVA